MLPPTLMYDCERWIKDTRLVITLRSGDNFIIRIRGAEKQNDGET